ncbi:Transmembrane 9 superfamily member 7 [Daldinia childiae]|uniref:Transmembrane 9 superfamily member 7 n=1 Tax=Daldinia childiae TaxID=326645 RepID=UPI001445EDBE|nr:Transmembrane 9 superfamily member 7 [Daldinia childiae]KAF3061029.1 Transmembrane 9 superfamily member 7 [Daldinia childiae]
MGESLRNSLKWLLYLLIVSQVHAFYIPGWSVKSYKEGEHIPLLVNKVYSDNTQLQYAYYDLPFVCPPTGKSHGPGLLSGQSISLNLGEVLRGDRIMTSDIDLTMGQDKECSFLCEQVVTRKDLRRAKELVREGYVVEWIVDNLPGATSFVTVDKSRKYYAAGFKLGFTDYSSSTGKPRYFLNNHHTIVIRYRAASGRAGEKGGKVVIGFEVYTKSIGPNVKRDNGCPADLHDVEDRFELYMAPNKTTDFQTLHPRSSYHPAALEEGDDDDTISIPYSYSVYFREDESIEWNRRWDLYFVNSEEGSRIHWLAIVNSLIICGLLTGIVLMILAKTIRSDIKGYKEGSIEEGKLRKGKSGKRSPKSEKAGFGVLEREADVDNEIEVASDDEALEDVTGWKLLHADVFRKPEYGHLLAPLVGSGMQLLFMAIGLVLLSAIGILNPSFRGGFLSAGFGLFVFAGVFSGYFSARVYKTFDGKDFGKNALVTAFLFPGLLFGLIFILNLFVWAQASSTAIPFGTLIAIVLLWLCIQVPLVYLGSWYGFVRTGAWEHPTKTASIPRQVPNQAWYAKKLQSILLAGLVPFAVIFIELLFVFQSLWQDKSGYYYVFGFLAVVSVILILTIAEVTVVTIYVQLCSENYHWWWQSFFVGGGSAIWVFLYSIWYYFANLHISGFVSSMLFFVYSFMACCVYGLLTGTVGFLTAYAFVRRIYGAIKAD